LDAEIVLCFFTMKLY